MGIEEFGGFMPNTIELEAWKSRDAYGEDTFGVAQSFRARIQMGNKIIRTATGNEAVSRGRIFVATIFAPSTKDRLTLPSPYTPAKPPILDVRPVQDESGIHHVVLFI